MWQKYPLIRILFPFIVGVLLFDYAFASINPLYFVSLGLFFTTITSIFWFRFSHRYQSIRGGFLLTSILILSIAYSGIYRDQSFKLPSKIATEKISYVATIIEPPTEKQRSIKIACKIDHYKKGDKMISTHEKCILYLAKDSLSNALNYGDKILFNTQLKEVPKALNPSEFDYRQSLLRKGVRYQSFIDQSSWEKFGDKNGNWVMQTAYQLRAKFLSILSKYQLDAQEYGVVAAILLGYDEKLDPELSAHYSGAGVTHVLCVSGMHVGVIYMILNFFLGFLDKKKKTKILKMAILLLLIWLYSSITGLSPSVMRSATMFSFIAIGNLLKQKVNTYHSLLASLFFLLIIDPFVIFNIGLQLSYLAVFGIVWLQRPLYTLWIPKIKAVDWVWQLASVSIAAQIVTTPISIYYFHQFPNYFLLSNIIVVFISSLVIYSGVAVIATSFWYWLSNILSYVMAWLIKAMNFVTIFISDLPGSKTSNIDLNFVSMMTLYNLIFFLIFAIFDKNKKWLWGSMVFSFLFLIQLTIDNYNEYKGNKITIYALNKQSVIDIKSSNELITLCDSASFKGDVPFQVKSARISDGVQPTTTILLSKESKWNRNGVLLSHQFICAGNKKIALINRQLAEDSNEAIHVDYALVFGNPYLKMAKACKSIQAETWAFDGSNSAYKVEKWVKECDSLNLNSYVIQNQGALVINF